MAYQVIAHIREANGTHQVRSPLYNGRAEADDDVAAIRDKQKEKASGGALTHPPVWIELPWLTVEASDIVSAHVTETSKSAARSGS
jgi:hypothetical protein